MRITLPGSLVFFVLALLTLAFAVTFARGDEPPPLRVDEPPPLYFGDGTDHAMTAVDRSLDGATVGPRTDARPVYYWPQRARLAPFYRAAPCPGGQ